MWRRLVLIALLMTTILTGTALAGNDKGYPGLAWNSSLKSLEPCIALGNQFGGVVYQKAGEDYDMGIANILKQQYVLRNDRLKGVWILHLDPTSMFERLKDQYTLVWAWDPISEKFEENGEVVVRSASWWADGMNTLVYYVTHQEKGVALGSALFMEYEHGLDVKRNGWFRK